MNNKEMWRTIRLAIGSTRAAVRLCAIMLVIEVAPVLLAHL